MTRSKTRELKKKQEEAVIAAALARSNAAAAASTPNLEANPDNEIPDLDNVGQKKDKGTGKNGRKRTLDSDNEAGPSSKKTKEEEENENLFDSEEILGNVGEEMTVGDENISFTDDENDQNSQNQGIATINIILYIVWKRNKCSFLLL